MRSARSFAAFVLFALMAGSLLAGPAQAGWRHRGGYGYGGCGYGGYGYGGYGYGGYGYGGYGYGGYAGYRYGGWSGPMAYSYSPSYSARAYSYRPAYGSQPYTANGSMAYGSQPSSGGQPYAAPAAAARPTTVLDIGAYDNYFQSNNVTVRPGTTVRWTNRGAHGHTVTSHHNLFDSGDIQPGATYTATFAHPGTYYYYCRHHTGEAMRGAITVEDSSGPVAGREPARAPAETARGPGGAAPAGNRTPAY